MQNKLISGIIKFHKTNPDLIQEVINKELIDSRYEKAINEFKEYSFIDVDRYDIDFEDISVEEFKLTIDRVKTQLEQELLKKLKLQIGKSKSLEDAHNLYSDVSAKQDILNQSEVSSETNLDFDFYNSFQGKPLIGIDTGIQSINDETDGIFGLFGITGSPGTGKTTMAIQFTAHALFNLKVPVIYLSLEVSKEMFIAKMVSNLIATPVKSIMKEYLPVDNAIEKYKTFLKVQNAKNLHIYDDSDKLTLAGLENKINDLEKEYGKRPLVVIDYFQLFKDDNVTKGGKTTIEREDMMMKAFIGLKNKTFANFLMIMQKNKGGYDGKSGMGGLKGSSSIEYGLETITSLERPDDLGGNFVEDCNVVLTVLKNRWGANHTLIPLHFDAKHSVFKEIENPDND